MPLLVQRVGRERLYPRPSRVTSAAGSGAPPPARGSTRSRCRNTSTTCRLGSRQLAVRRDRRRPARSPSRPTGRSSRCRATSPSCPSPPCTPSSTRSSTRSPSSSLSRAARPQTATRWSSTSSAPDGSRSATTSSSSARPARRGDRERHPRPGAGESQRDLVRARRRLDRKVTVDLKEIKERVLPPLDDDLARAGTEFDTLAELRTDIEARLLAQVQRGARRAVPRRRRRRAGPRVERRRDRPARRGAHAGASLRARPRSPQARGIDAATYLAGDGRHARGARGAAPRRGPAVGRRELVLDAVADKLEITVDDDEIRTRVAERRRVRRGHRRVHARRVGPTASATICA